MAEIKALRDNADFVGKNEPVPKVIQMCELLLEEAKSGKIRDMAFVAIYADTDYRIDYGGNGRALAILGGVNVLQHWIGSILSREDVKASDDGA